jgi:hypothetical protein
MSIVNSKLCLFATLDVLVTRDDGEIDESSLAMTEVVAATGVGIEFLELDGATRAIYHRPNTK